MSGPPLDDRFVRFVADRNETLRNELVLEHQGLALAFARRYVRAGRDDDLDQVALEALIDAVDRFEPDRGVRFSTYAARVIDGRLKQYFRDDSWDVRVPRSLKQLAVSVRSVTDELTNSLGRLPTTTEVAEQLGVTVDQVVLALDAATAHHAEELDTEPAASSEWDDVDAEIMVPDLLDRLPPQERTVVALRFFGELSQSQIAERIGVSQMQVSRLLRRALERLRTITGDTDG